MAKYEPKNIDCNKVRPHLLELIVRCGSAEQAADYIGIGVSTMYRLRHKEHCTMQMVTARKILDGLLNKRAEDRINGATHPALQKMKQQQANLEAHMQELQELTGY